ncbi:4935_t:CDS:2 [Gigaspora margarita]|uniref:4935_t:CDS:1 n=1 Tax=Gigaspora margarita TaxID=4874 RepID=A0ABN7USW4_GIGMA|nr:4935_t:CDS:2 [Gigaspora margarita]
MEASREFEAAQESFTERLNKQDEKAAQKRTDSGTKNHQLSEINLAEHVQLMELDSQLEQSEVAKGPGKEI